MSGGHENGFFKGRALDLFKLEPPVRRIVLTTAMVLLAVALGCALREDFPGPITRLPDGYVIPVAVTLIAAATAIFGLALLVAGAAHARSRWRWAVLVPVAFGLSVVLLAALGDLSASWPVWQVRAVIAASIVLPPVCILAAALVGPRLRAAQTFWIIFTISIACTLAVIAVSLFVTPDFGASFILYLVGVGAVALEPALLVVGFDLADIGSDAVMLGQRGVESRSGLIQRLARVAAFAFAIAATIFFFSTTHFAPTQHIVAAGWIVAIGTAMVLVAIATARRATPPQATSGAQYQYLLLVSAAVTAAALILSLSSEPLPGLYSAKGLRSYSFAPPEGLARQEAADWPPPGNEFDPTWPARTLYTGSGGWPLLAVVGVPRPPFAGTHKLTGLNGIISHHDLPHMPVVLGAAAANGWAHGEAATADKKGHAFRFAIRRKQVPTTDVATDIDWYIVCGDTAANIAASRARCSTLASTFEPQARQRTSRTLALVFDLLFFAGAAGVFLFARRRNRTSDTAGLDFAFWALFLNGLRGILGCAGTGLNFPFYDTNVSALLIFVLLVLFAAIGVVLELLPSARRFDLVDARRAVASAAASLLVICILFVLYVFAIRGSDESQVIRGVIICFALLWELLMSGERLNLSAEHHLFPRSSRVFLLVGYLLMVATVVFLITGLKDGEGKSGTGWNSELFVANGIVLLGSALIISRAVRAFARTAKRAPA